MWLEGLSLLEQHRTVSEPANGMNNWFLALILGLSPRIPLCGYARRKIANEKKMRGVFEISSAPFPASPSHAFVKNGE